MYNVDVHPSAYKENIRTIVNNEVKKVAAQNKATGCKLEAVNFE